MCRCGHPMSFHNPCSVCECPRFTEGKKAKFALRDTGGPNRARALIEAELAESLKKLREGQS